MEMDELDYNRYNEYSVNSNNIRSLTFKDVSGWRYVWLGVEISLAKYAHDTKHSTWAIIFGLLSLGTAGSIIEDIVKH